MKFLVRAKPNAKAERIEKLDDGSFLIAVKDPPLKGRANLAIAKMLAGFFGVAPSRVRLKSGFSSPQKVFEIL